MRFVTHLAYGLLSLLLSQKCERKSDRQLAELAAGATCAAPGILDDVPVAAALPSFPGQNRPRPGDRRRQRCSAALALAFAFLTPLSAWSTGVSRQKTLPILCGINIWEPPEHFDFQSSRPLQRLLQHVFTAPGDVFEQMRSGSPQANQPIPPILSRSQRHIVISQRVPRLLNILLGDLWAVRAYDNRRALDRSKRSLQTLAKVPASLSRRRPASLEPIRNFALSIVRCESQLRPRNIAQAGN